MLISVGSPVLVCVLLGACGVLIFKMFYDKMCVVRFEIVENDGKKKVFLVFCGLVKFGFLVLSMSLCDLTFSILAF